MFFLPCIISVEMVLTAYTHLELPIWTVASTRPMTGLIPTRCVMADGDAPHLQRSNQETGACRDIQLRPAVASPRRRAV
jgi:hypothetical protein